AAIRTDGWVLARHPQLDQTINIKDSPLFNDHIPVSPGGFYHNSTTAADGQSRIVGYRVLENWPIVTTIGIERGETLHYYWISLRSGLLVGIPLMGLLVLGMLWILRLLKADAGRRMALEEALKRNNFLMREIHHRVKNNLQAVSSLVRLQ